MRVLVCGGRDYEDDRLLRQVLGGLAITGIIEGGARGADTLARRYAEEHGIDVQTFPAKWNEYGKSAGAIRNAQMLAEGNPDAVVAFPGGKGTWNMIQRTEEAGIPLLKITENQLDALQWAKEFMDRYERIYRSSPTGDDKQRRLREGKEGLD